MKPERESSDVGKNVARSTRRAPESRTRDRALEDLRDSYEQVCRHQNVKPPLPALVMRDLQDWSREVRRSARLGLLFDVGRQRDPAIRAARKLVAVARALGARSWLRTARVGLERGTRRPLSGEQLELANDIAERLEPSKKRTRQRETIRRLLINTRRIPRMWSSAFYKLLAGLEVDGIAQPKVNKRLVASRSTRLAERIEILRVRNRARRGARRRQG